MKLILIAVAISSCFICSEAGDLTLKKLTLPCGREIPPIGLGSYDDRKKNEQQKLKGFLDGIEAGYRLIDTAYEYENERHLGLAVKQLIANKKINRDELFITTKVWNTFHTKERALENVRYELRDLGLNFTDLTLLHFPVSVIPGVKDHATPREYYTLYANGSIQAPHSQRDIGYVNAWRGLEAAHRLGLAKHIGVANFNIHQLKKLHEVAVLKPVVLQAECHPLYRNDKLTNWAKSKNMTVICYSPMRKCSPELINNAVLQEIAEKHQKSVRQVALRWNMQRGNIVIPRSYDKYHQKENLDTLNFALEDDDMSKINTIPQIEKIIFPGYLLPVGMPNHPDYPFGSDDDN